MEIARWEFQIYKIDFTYLIFYMSEENNSPTEKISYK